MLTCDMYLQVIRINIIIIIIITNRPSAFFLL